MARKGIVSRISAVRGAGRARKVLCAEALPVGVLVSCVDFLACVASHFRQRFPHMVLLAAEMSSAGFKYSCWVSLIFWASSVDARWRAAAGNRYRKLLKVEKF